MQRAVGCGIKLVVFSDLDGTFLFPEDYKPGPARKALKICQGEGIPLVFVSSKTRAEIEKIRRELGDSDPFISENGGALFLPKAKWERPAGWVELDGYWCLVLGKLHPLLCSALREAASAAAAQILGFSAMPVSQVAEITGLPEEDAKLARMREFDEPFVILNESKEVISRLQKEINASGFHYTKGGVFHHITGGCDKGKAVQKLMNLYRRANPGIRFAAVGDAVNDLPMLRAVDQPFLVRKSGGLFEEAACFNGVTLTEGIGPLGFVEAINLLRKSVK